jgi:tyrosinase
MATSVSTAAIGLGTLDDNYSRADIEFHGLDHSGASYEGRVYLNNPDANEDTGRSPEAGYAGSYHIFGHGGCLGDEGHCEVKPRRRYDPRSAHPLTPARKVVICTDAVRRAAQSGGEVTVTVVPVITATGAYIDNADDVLAYDHVRIVTYR